MAASRQCRRIALIAGAGPAGLTAALELLRRSDITPIIVEADSQVGGISKTVNYRGNRMDLGGHRFFSKSDWVMRWWQDILPVAQDPESPATMRLAYQQSTTNFTPANLAAATDDAVMLVRQRLSRIFYRRRFFDYPLRITARTLRNMGLLEILRVGMSYGRAQLLPHAAEATLEEFLINRFGERLYRTFFKDYTEKVWGVPCCKISAEWGAQRIKGLSVTKALAHAVSSPFRSMSDTTQKGTETSLIERFLYPKLGPGQMWEEVARRIQSLGGEVHLRQRVVALQKKNLEIVSATVRDETDGSVRTIPCEFFLSTMPVRELAGMLQPDNAEVIKVAEGLPYRDFMTAGLLLRQMNLGTNQGDRSVPIGMPPDNWIYIQEPDVKIGRLQIFNNWSPSLVQDPSTIWLGLEYFCNETDAIWSMDSDSFVSFAAAELEKIGMIDRNHVLDGTMVRVPRAYPAYFGEYSRFSILRDYLARFSNLYPVGRNGMHRYNNQDHSMLAANAAVSSMINAGEGKSAIWQINAEEDYHEEIKEVA